MRYFEWLTPCEGEILSVRGANSEGRGEYGVGYDGLLNSPE